MKSVQRIHKKLHSELHMLNELAAGLKRLREREVGRHIATHNMKTNAFVAALLQKSSIDGICKVIDILFCEVTGGMPATSLNKKSVTWQIAIHKEPTQ